MLRAWVSRCLSVLLLLASAGRHATAGEILTPNENSQAAAQRVSVLFTTRELRRLASSTWVFDGKATFRFPGKNCVRITDSRMTFTFGDKIDHGVMAGVYQHLVRSIESDPPASPIAENDCGSTGTFPRTTTGAVNARMFADIKQINDRWSAIVTWDLMTRSQGGDNQYTFDFVDDDHIRVCLKRLNGSGCRQLSRDVDSLKRKYQQMADSLRGRWYARWTGEKNKYRMGNTPPRCVVQSTVEWEFQLSSFDATSNTVSGQMIRTDRSIVEYDPDNEVINRGNVFFRHADECRRKHDEDMRKFADVFVKLALSGSYTFNIIQKRCDGCNGFNPAQFRQGAELLQNGQIAYHVNDKFSVFLQKN